ncbi:MAG: MarR family transcriptional regulator [Clostridia bacterium]|nr:MarR family transcriptional regulator [Clostridia bacterium]
MKPEKTIGFSVRSLHNLIKRDIEKSKIFRMECASGLHGWAIGYFFNHQGEEIFQRDFEEEFSIRRSTASNILRLMEENGLIERVRVAEDARLKRIVLTDRAIQLHKMIIEDMEQREKRLRKGLTDEELASFFYVMEKIKANLEEQND